MKKIVFLIAHLGNGGAERVSVNLANEFYKRQYDVYAIVFHKGEVEYELTKGIHKTYLDLNGEGTFGKIKNLRKQLRKIQPDYVIELGFAIKYILVGGLINKYSYIFSMRNDPQMSMKESKSIFKYFRKYYFRHAKYIVFQTPDAMKYYPKDIQKKGVVIPNPIKSVLPERYIGKRRHIIAAFSRLNKQKNIPMMLDAFKLFLQKYPDYKLKIYGRGEEIENLKNYASKIGVDQNVDFCGFCKNIHYEIIDYMMFVSSSNYEGISNSMIEALGIGLPCVCTDCPAGGARMFIKDGINGFLSPVGDAYTFSEKMLTLAANEDLCEMFSKSAVTIRQELSCTTICDQWEKLIQ